MVYEEEEKKRIYDETASLITRQALLNKLDHEELHFLLDLLDCVVVTDQQRSFIDVLHRWVNTSLSHDDDLAVKNIILSTDISDEAKADTSIKFIEELLCSSTKSAKGKEESEDEQFLDL